MLAFYRDDTVTALGNETVEAAMGSIGRYDQELQMFCEPMHEPGLMKLRFLRWLAEQGKLEHEISSQPTGEYAGPVGE